MSWNFLSYNISPYDQVVRCSGVFVAENRRETGSLLTRLAHPVCSTIMSVYTYKSQKQYSTQFSYCYYPVASRQNSNLSFRFCRLGGNFVQLDCVE
jgi:hypothetical protein